MEVTLMVRRHTEPAITLPEVWHRPGSTAAESVLLVSERCNHYGFGAVMLRDSRPLGCSNSDWCSYPTYAEMANYLLNTGWERLPKGSAVTLTV